MFIVFEGPDKVGKTTQAKKLVEMLNEDGIPAVYTREPGGSAFSEELRKILKTTRMNNHVATMLFTAARFDHVHQFIYPSINSGKVVVCDRFLDSSYAYQCFADVLTREQDDMSNEECIALVRALSEIKCNYQICKLLIEKAYGLMEKTMEHRYLCSPFTDGMMLWTDMISVGKPLVAQFKKLGKDEPTIKQITKLLRLMDCISELHHAIVKLVPDHTIYLEGTVSDEVPVYSDIYENVSVEYKKMLEFGYNWLYEAFRIYPFVGRRHLVQTCQRSVESIAAEVRTKLKEVGVFDGRK